jgi:predicted Rossmann-fold nucleotide-binding protein
MKRSASRVVTRRLIEIESLADFDAHISRTMRLNGWFIQSVDLTERSDALLKVDPSGAVFLGCLFAPYPYGPGAMEAANLGAYLSCWPGSLDDALMILVAAPSYRASMDAWAKSAFRVRARWPIVSAGRSLSIPTWFYGHKPTNVFATEIAKYFSNALRENTLLHRCGGGVVYLPGQAGTVQEIFQSVTENFYAADASLVTPLILIGREYWTAVYPAWPLLQRLGADRPMGEVIHCVDDVKEAVDILTRRPYEAAALPGCCQVPLSLLTASSASLCCTVPPVQAVP